MDKPKITPEVVAYVAALYDVADDYQAQTLEEIQVAAGVLVKCAECGECHDWDTVTGVCDNCGKPLDK